MDLQSLRFLKSHEWARREGDIVTVGITQYAVDQLVDVTFLELPKPGKAVTAEKPFGVIESVKAAFDLYAPVTGEIVERNEKLIEKVGFKPDFTTLNRDPYGAGWMIKIKLASGANLDHLKTLAQYEDQLASEAH